MPGGPMGALATLGLAVAALASACATEATGARWAAGLVPVERAFEAGRYEEALSGFRRLRATTTRPVDRDLMAMREAETLVRMGRPEGVRRYLALGDRAQRRMDRARARYRVAVLAEDLGRREAARRMYRRLARTYPNLMPGLRALAHLERFAREDGAPGVAAHLAWTRRVYPALAHTELADNFLYYAARQAYARWVAGGDRGLADLAERLYRRITREHVQSGHWNDAWWDLSWLFHHQGRYAEEVDAIRRIRAAKGPPGLFGNPSHVFYTQGELRVARLMVVHLADLPGAVASFDRFLADNRTSRWRDDVLYYQGCVYLRLGRADAAERAFARIPEVYAESKYLRRLERARQDPEGEHCVPPRIDEEDT